LKGDLTYGNDNKYFKIRGFDKIKCSEILLTRMKYNK
jgi:hypothetical protein